MHKTKSTAEKILKWLQSGHSITFLDALRRFNTISLRERVRDLREKGFDIKSEMVERGGKRYSRYFLRSA